MAITYGFVWALWWWRTTPSNIQTNTLRNQECHLELAVDGIRKLKARGVTQTYQLGLQRGIPGTIAIEVVEAGKPHYANSPTVTLHQWNGFLPMWSLCSMNPGPQGSTRTSQTAGLDQANTPQNVSSPELCLQQIAGTIHTHVREHLDAWQYVVILAELSCELCGTYSKANTLRGFKNRTVPLTSVSSLAIFAGRMANEPGAPKLRETITWTLDNLHSPMETVLYLMLCLPQWYGGMELPRPYANYQLNVSSNLWPKTRLRSIYPDLFWPEANLIVEYDSEEVHDGREKQDQERQELAQDMGFKVITFRLADLKSASRFRAKAQSVASYLKRELPAPTPAFDALQAKLRNMLLFHERWI